jgi:hypothetical protein
MCYVTDRLTRVSSSETGKFNQQGIVSPTRMRVLLQLKQRRESHGKSTGINIKLFPITRTSAAAIKNFTAPSTYLNQSRASLQENKSSGALAPVLASPTGTFRKVPEQIPFTSPKNGNGLLSRNVFSAVRTEFLRNI